MDIIDAANCLAADSGGMPPSIRPDVIDTLDRRPSPGERAELWCKRHRSLGAYWCHYARHARRHERRPHPVGFARWLGDDFDAASAVAVIRRKWTRRP